MRKKNIQAEWEVYVVTSLQPPKLGVTKPKPKPSLATLNPLHDGTARTG